MKKIIAGMLGMSMLFLTTTMAFAERELVYDTAGNNVAGLESAITAGVTKTVLITKVAELDGTSVENGDIVYIDQSDNGFETTVQFMLKENPAKGVYRASFGNSAGTAPTSIEFVIGDVEINRADVMAVADEAEAYTKIDGAPYYKKGFTKVFDTADDYSKYKSIKLLNPDHTTVIGAIDITGWTATSGESEMAVGVQVYGVPENMKDFEMFFSTEEAVLRTETN